MYKKIGVVIVSHGHQNLLAGLTSALAKQKKPGDKIVIIDNHPKKKSALIAKSLPSVDSIIVQSNHGFAAACNIAAKCIEGEVDLLLFINPDTIPSPDTLKILREQHGDSAISMPLILLPGGMVNSAGNVVHISGLSWCEGFGSPASIYMENKQVRIASGACLCVAVDWWHELGGMDEDYFMYYEDTDLSTRVLLLGGDIVLLPLAHVEHDYDYKKGQHKWLYIERNRPLFIIKCWPFGVILVLFPFLLFSEIALWVVAIMERRFVLKVRALVMMIRGIPGALSARRSIQHNRKISTLQFYENLEYDLNTPLLGAVSQRASIRYLLKLYYKSGDWLLTKFSS